MRKMARMKRQRSYSENSTLDTLKIVSDVTKPLNITTNPSTANDANWRRNTVLPRRRYLSVGNNFKLFIKIKLFNLLNYMGNYLF